MNPARITLAASAFDPRLRDAATARLEGDLRRGLAEAAGIVAADAAAFVLAARDPERPLPSALAASIEASLDPGSLEAAVSAGGPSAPYAPFVEFGTAQSPARPFLHPALVMNRTRIFDALRSASREEGAS